MATQLINEEKMIIEMVREFAKAKVAPRAAEIDAKGEFPWDMVAALAKQDIFALLYGEEYGGTASSTLTAMMVIEELAKHCATTALLLAVQELATLPIRLAGTEEQKARFFPKMATGEWLGAYGLTEPSSGSDAGGMKTKAVRKGDTYILNGGKRFITNAGVAHVNIVFAVTEPGIGTKGISAFIVEKGTPGFALGKIEHKMGICGSQTGELLFDECEVPAENLLGREGEGFKIAMMTLDRSRPGVAAQALGIAQGALDYAIEYAKQRTQFSTRLADMPTMQFQFADMATQIEASRLLLYRVAEMIDNQEEPLSRMSAMCKLMCSDTAMRVTTDAVQVLGGYGYMKEFPVERMMRDAKITQIYEGTNQIQRLVIGRDLVK